MEVEGGIVINDGIPYKEHDHEFVHVVESPAGKVISSA